MSSRIEEYRKKYGTIIVYGIGEYYHRYRDRILNEIGPDYISDRAFESDDSEVFDGVRTLRPDEIKEMAAPVVVITIEKHWVVAELKQHFSDMGIVAVHAGEFLGPSRRFISGKELLKAAPDGRYVDEVNNRINFDETVSPNWGIHFYGSNNTVNIGRGVSINTKVYLLCASNCVFDIGENTEIWDAEFVLADSKISVGRDCLFSRRIELRCHDSHPIFDGTTGERLNYPKDIQVGDQVWVGEDVLLLGGASIGDGSVIGARCVTSSQFEDHVVIAGVPGKVHRRNIRWSRDDIQYFVRDRYDECIDKNALKYLG